MSPQNKLMKLIESAKPIIDSIGDHLLIIDNNFKIIYDSGMCREMPTKSFVGSYCHKAYQNLNKPCPDCPVAKTFLDGESHKTIKELTAPNGKKIHIEVVSTALRSDKGEIIAGIEVVRNVSDRVAIDEELRKSKLDLELRVQEKTADLARACNQLHHAEKLSIVGELAASVAHEFGNPIFGIRNLLEKLQTSNSLAQEDRLLLGVAVDECNRLKKLIYKLQDMSRPDNSPPTPINMREIIGEVVLLIRQNLLEKNIRLNITSAENLPTVHAIEDQIRQVLLNLLKNASEASPHKGQITISTEANNGFLFTTVHNTGRSIHAGDQQDLFKPFFTTKNKKGTGLGLSVSNTIVKNHGGTLSIHSRARQGTAFVFSLPIAGDTMVYAHSAPHAHAHEKAN